MKLLIANRGEIACRILRACRQMGLTSVAVFSDVDEHALHVRLADEAYCLGPAPARESYLHSEKILAVAKKAKAKLIHPGYGFLSENAHFAKACEKKGFLFVGPSSQTIALLGDKLKARRLAELCGVPTIKGTLKEVRSAQEFSKLCRQLKLPVMVKAVGGGGGKGIRIVHNRKEAEAAFELASSEAKTSFKNPKIYVEQFLEGARHIEIQLIADRFGKILSLGERECSIQRRFQKLIEESPSPMMDAALLEKMEQAAIKIFQKSNYTNAGTVEFLIDRKKNFHFLEVNTRLQVEHPVTEMVRSVDLVCEQIRVALGQKLSFGPDDCLPKGHAIEVRIYAEDPEYLFLPSSGKIEMLQTPSGKNIRLDSSLYPGMEVSLYYDPLLAKLIASGKTRKEAILRMQTALSEFVVNGIKTTIPFSQELLRAPSFQKGKIDIQFVERWMKEKKKSIQKPELKAALAGLLYHLNKEKKERIPFKVVGKKLSSWQQKRDKNEIQRSNWVKRIPSYRS